MSINKGIYLICFVVVSLLCMATSAYANDPVLYFSDLIEGPKTGIGDGLGSGAIVTV